MSLKAKLVFLGTRGEIEARTTLHGMHSSLLICLADKRLMVDCGLDWLGKLAQVAPDAILLTHAHMDHAWGLREGAPCPVYAPERTWTTLQDCRVENPVTVALRKPTPILGATVETFPIEHSIRCPAVGYRIGLGDTMIFYSPDVVYIPEREAALGGTHIYIGDGASISRSMVRRRGDAIFGHAPVRAQLTWCQKEKVPRAIFTHCGAEIVESNREVVEEKIAELAAERGVRAQVARDGMELQLELECGVRA